jgi:hypothetical protein
LPDVAPRTHRWRVISGVILHLENDLPVLVDLEELPGSGDRLLRCTNVRTIDGKRPSFVNDRHGTFIFPVDVIRLIEAPSDEAARARQQALERSPLLEPAAPAIADEEPDESLLARIRDI